MAETRSASLRVDVAFQASTQGPPIGSDHGYALFASLCRLQAGFHGAEWLAIHPLAGQAVGSGLTMRRGVPALRLRVPPEKIADVLPLAGKTLDVMGTRPLVGVSQLYVLRPYAALASRLVTMKGYVEPQPFEERIKKELADRGVQASLQVGRRRVVTVDGDKVVGFAVRLEGLSDEDSLKVQYAGLGGRQRFGCGVFGPATREWREAS